MKTIVKDSITVGADIEVFLKDFNGGFISSIGLLGGSKHSPRDLGDGFAVLEDNVLAEFNMPYATTQEKFVNLVEQGLHKVQQVIPGGLLIDIRSSAFMPIEQLQAPGADQFGCEPDYNAWNKGRPNKRPAIPTNGLRSSGGHIHVGYKVADAGTDKAQLAHDSVKLMDLFLGIPSILMDKDQHRRTLYGKAGAHRKKPYGFEYRVLSSFWCADVDKINWAYQQTHRAMSSIDDVKEIIDPMVARAIQTTINTADTAAAEELVKEFNLVAL